MFRFYEGEQELLYQLPTERIKSIELHTQTRENETYTLKGPK